MKRKEDASVSWEEVSLKANPKTCDEAVAREVIDGLWPYAVCIPDVMWNARQHILDTELGEKNDSKN